MPCLLRWPRSPSFPCEARGQFLSEPPVKSVTGFKDQACTKKTKLAWTLPRYSEARCSHNDMPGGLIHLFHPVITWGHTHTLTHTAQWLWRLSLFSFMSRQGWMQKLQVSVTRLGHGEVSSHLSAPQTLVTCESSQKQAASSLPWAPSWAPHSEAGRCSPPWPRGTLPNTGFKNWSKRLCNPSHFVAFYECEERSDGSGSW